MTYKVCITAAGRGTRLAAAQGTHKALVPLAGRAVLSRILDKVPADAEVVIALGHAADQIRSFLAVAAPGRAITFVDVPGYDGPGSGPGASLLACRPHLQCPFVLFACDTLVDEDVPPPDADWVGVADVEAPDPFLIADVQRGRVAAFYDKCPRRELPADLAAPYQAFIGLAGVRDYGRFWTSLDGGTRLVRGERQVASGFEGLVAGGLQARRFTWFDTGTDAGVQAAAARFGTSDWLPKPDEALFFEGGRVIKYFADASRVQRRGERAILLKDVVPPNVEARGNFLAYDYVPGRLLSDQTDECVFRRFVERAAETVWRPMTLGAGDARRFRDAADRFYRVKTAQRVHDFLERYPAAAAPVRINGQDVPAVDEALTAIPWDTLADGTPVLFHGDPQPENVLLADDGRIVMLDWRDDFGGLTGCGDLYYDLAKVHHALIVSGQVVRANGFSTTPGPGTVETRLLVPEHLLRFLKVFEQAIEARGWDVGRTRLTSALTYLNIALLHHAPYDQFLFSFGRFLLQRIAGNRWPY